MSSNPDEYSSSSARTDHNNNNRVEPRFFGHPSIYQNTAPQKKNNSAPPPTENHHWVNPPPPYSPAPNEPESSNSSATIDPSAPPLELPFIPHIQHSIPQTQAPTSPSTPSSSSGNYPQLNYQNQQKPQNYPPQGYGHYGAVNQQQHPFVNPNITTSDANLPIISNWPWIAPPSGAGSQPLMGYSPPSQTQHHQQQQPYYYNPDKKKKTCFELFLKYVFYFFCICLVIKIINLLSGGVSYADSCSHGFIWRALPEQFEFTNQGVRIRVIGGSLSGGHISVKRQTGGDQVNASVGLAKITALVSPAGLADNPDLTYSITHLNNGSTTLELYIPLDLSSRACVSLNAVIYIPESLEFMVLDVQNANVEVSDEVMNIDTIFIGTTNQAIEFGPKWMGKTLELGTKNAHIEIVQAIENADIINVHTTNGGIRFRQPITAIKDCIIAQSTNAGIDVDTIVQAPAISLATTNGHVIAENIHANRAELKATNNRIEVNHANISKLLNTQTTNGAVLLHLDEGNHSELIARTTNSQITLYMPAKHESHVEIETSRTNKIEFTDPLGWSHLTYNGRGSLTGIRYNPESSKTPDTGHLHVKTTNANIHVHYADSDY